MKALFISNDPKIFEEESAVRVRMRAYATQTEELHIISRAHFGAKEMQEGSLFLHPVYAPPIFSLLFLLRKAHHIVKKYGIEIISAQDPFEYGWIALQVSRKKKVKLHIQIHTDLFSPWFSRESLKNTIRQLIARQVLSSADRIRAVSERIKKSLETTLQVHPPITVIPIAVPVPDTMPIHKSDAAFTLITVSRFEPEKRIEDILKALALVRTHYRNVSLRLVGEGSQRQYLYKKARALGIQDAITFVPWQKDVFVELSKVHAFIQASAYEGYGRTLVEAALAKVPIITTDVGIVGELFIPGEEVLVAPVSAPRILADHIETIIRDHRLRYTLPLNAHERATQHLKQIHQNEYAVIHDVMNT